MDTKEEFLDAPVCFNVDWIEAQDLREETPSLSVSRGGWRLEAGVCQAYWRILCQRYIGRAIVTSLFYYILHNFQNISNLRLE